ncbi:MAG: hypothetical protein WC517_01725 [Patescibacteria group bacterium]
MTENRLRELLRFLPLFEYANLREVNQRVSINGREGVECRVGRKLFFVYTSGDGKILVQEFFPNYFHQTFASVLLEDILNHLNKIS